ncbi:MAG: hypothetical protein IJL74_01745 [Bacilli bacterium]|nr:hypothetical protein [Bacilli bacterium]
MKLEKEITVLVNTSYEELNTILTQKGFEIVESFFMKDIYMIDKNVNMSDMNNLDILKKCILIRETEGGQKKLIYKHKKYDKDERIIEQAKIECPISDVNKAIDFMKAINYKTLFTINDKCTVYCNKKTEFIVQEVNDKYVFIEMEDKAESIDKEYKTIDDMIGELKEYNLPIQPNNFFVKKAELILKETL